MRSALRSALSAAGLGLICFLLAKATWQQVLLLFLFASFAWCLIVWQRENNRALYGPRPVIRRRREMVESYVSPSTYSARAAKRTAAPALPAALSRPEPARMVEQRRTIYRFPIHELARTSKPRPAEP